jgi:hypothetical protein
MRKKLKIISYILLALFLFRSFFLGTNSKYEVYIVVVYLFFVIPYLLYESVQRTKDDPNSKTSTLGYRIIMAIIGSIALILLFLALYKDYPD